MSQILNLISDEGWKIRQHKKNLVVITQYENVLGPLKVQHPALIHLNIYKEHTDPDTRYQHFKKAHDYFWPTTVWHDWTERRFRTHCEDWNYITLAAGASASKSYDIAKLAILFWYAAPQERNVTIASVTLSSLMTRVWGYLTAHIKSMAITLPYKYYRSNPPSILFEDPAVGKNKVNEDTLHGIFSVTARVGDDDQAVATWIGKHPKDKILLILDECTDMPLSILNALPNLNSHPEKFQLIGIGNSNSTQDLHGLLSTPKNGWESVSPELSQWDTTQLKGTCLYFSPYESPAILDEDPERRKKLSVFLMGEDNLREKEKELGKDSEKFYRWVLGFWKSRATDDVVVSEKFILDKDYNPAQKVEWSGYYPLTRIASLDPAFCTDGDKCILRVATVGHTFSNKVKIDLGHGAYTFEIKLQAISGLSIEKQIAEETVRLLRLYRIPLTHFAVDVTGQGRAIAEVISLVNEKQGYPLGTGVPLKIYSMSPHNLNKSRKKNAIPDILPMNSNILWNTLRGYISEGQVCGLDEKTSYQLTNRLVVTKVLGNKRIERLENKKEYKRKMSAIGRPHSPDEADAAALLIQVMKLRLGIEPGTTWPTPAAAVTDPKIRDKLFAYHVTTEKRNEVLAVIEADCEGGLENFLNFKTPF